MNQYDEAETEALLSLIMAEGRHVFRSKSRVKGLEVKFVIG